MKIDLLVKNVINVRVKHKGENLLESKHDGPRYPWKDCEAPLNTDARLKCDKCENTLVFRTLMFEHTCYTHDDKGTPVRFVVIK